MPVMEAGRGDSAGGDTVPAGASPRAQPPGRITRVVRRLALALAVVAVAAGAAGFLWFVRTIPGEEVELDRRADGIVVLTGGSSRIADAIELLASGRGERLLITGVNRSTNTGEISRLRPAHERLVRCCVDLDHSALNTLGNAIETRRWARERGFRSLIVVTSNYHMPRAMAELAHQLPDVALIPFPVVSEKVRTEPWWSHAATARLLAMEYVKYIVAGLRIRLEPVGAVEAGARASALAGHGMGRETKRETRRESK